MITVAFSLWLALLAALPLVALARGRRARDAAPPPEGPLPTGGVLLRPCTGTPPWLSTALATVPVGAPGLRLRFSVDRADDPALPVARAVAERLCADGHDASVVVLGGPGLNRKAAQLVAGAGAFADAPFIVVADADVDLAAVDLRPLAGPLLDASAAPAPAAVWQPVVEGPGDTPADRASAALLGASLHAFPLIGRLDPTGLVGKLFAFDPRRVSACGALTAGVDVLGEDMALAGRLAAHGEHTALAPGAARSLARGRSAEAMLERYTRWLLVVRTQRPGRLWSYPVLFLGPWGLACGGLGLAVVDAGAGLALALGALLVRHATAEVARRLAGDPRARLPRPPVRDLIAADALLACAFVSALRARSVTWAGRRLSVGAPAVPARRPSHPSEHRPHADAR
ncbi:glycosyltransferase [Myxococcota bacterium]|nr:glycosyltransferase [Myxococcota bacterium]